MVKMSKRAGPEIYPNGGMAKTDHLFQTAKLVKMVNSKCGRGAGVIKMLKRAGPTIDNKMGKPKFAIKWHSGRAGKGNR